jgi:GR25 family glycosyltransferase involved in LPS biosynthesis
MRIDQIFILTLPHRQDNLYRLTSQLNLFGIDYEIFYGVNGKNIVTDYQCDNLNNGCTASHGQIIQRAKIMGLDNCLILEDDCILSDDFIQQLDSLKLPENWKVCYLSGSHREYPIKVNDVFSLCTKTFTTHAYIINSSFFNEISDKLLTDYKQPVDCYFVDLQNEHEMYVLNKPAAWQSGGYSDVNKRDMYYDWLKDEINV